MKTADEVLHDFGLHDLERLPRQLLIRRIRSLAEYVETYEQSFEQLSQTLSRRTRKMRDAEDREAETARHNEALRIALAERDHILQTLMAWHTALGSPDEPQAMADLREAIVAHQYRLNR